MITRGYLDALVGTGKATLGGTRRAVGDNFCKICRFFPEPRVRDAQRRAGTMLMRDRAARVVVPIVNRLKNLKCILGQIRKDFYSAMLGHCASVVGAILPAHEGIKRPESYRVYACLVLQKANAVRSLKVSG